MKLAKTLVAGFAAVALSVCASAAQAAPITISFTGTMTSSNTTFYTPSAGSLINSFGYGDTFTISATFDTADTGVPFGANTLLFLSPQTLTMSLNGHTYTSVSTDAGFTNYRYTIADQSQGSQKFELVSNSNSTSAGATTTNSSITGFGMDWNMYDLNGGPFDWNNPVPTDSFDPSLFLNRRVLFGMGNSLNFIQFDYYGVGEGDFTVTSSGTGVPAPGALALLGLGLLGVGGLRRRA